MLLLLSKSQGKKSPCAGISNPDKSGGGLFPWRLLKLPTQG